MADFYTKISSSVLSLYICIVVHLIYKLNIYSDDDDDDGCVSVKGFFSHFVIVLLQNETETETETDPMVIGIGRREGKAHFRAITRRLAKYSSKP